MSEQTIKCPICGEPYVFYPFMVGDQSACPDCRNRARVKKWEDRTGPPVKKDE